MIPVELAGVVVGSLALAVGALWRHISKMQSDWRDDLKELISEYHTALSEFQKAIVQAARNGNGKKKN